MPERIAKRLAAAGIASRRGAEEMILEGRVSVNGDVLTTPAVTVSETDVITVDGKPIAEKSDTRLFLYHKPTGILCTHKDPHGRPTVFDNLPKNLPRLISIGRLDLNSEGLLLLTNDGTLAEAMMHPRNELPRTYRARVLGTPSEGMIKALKRGISIDGLRYRPIEMKVANTQGTGRNKWLHVTVHEGKNREVRKALEAVGLTVNRLIRTHYGEFELGPLPRHGTKEVPFKQVQKLITSLKKNG